MKDEINQQIRDPRLEELQERETKIKKKERKSALTKDRRVRIEEEDDEDDQLDDKNGQFYNHGQYDEDMVRSGGRGMEDEPKTIKEILDRDDVDPESNKTIFLYFGNLLTFVLVMLIYYGLVILFMISTVIHLYDYTYNYDEFKINFGIQDPGLEFHEFKSSD